MHLPLNTSLSKLNESTKEFINLFEHGTLSIELYQPNIEDKQQPHDRDEVYIIASGNGTFYNDGKRINFNTGDFLFVPAYKEHRFENFSKNFSTWVIFYGPKGGEKK